MPLPYDGPEWSRFAAEIERELLPRLRDSELTVSLIPSDPSKVDVKIAVELGLSILLGKPLIAVVAPGAVVPEGLILVADEIVELGPDPTSWGTAEALHDAISRVLARREQGL